MNRLICRAWGARFARVSACATFAVLPLLHGQSHEGLLAGPTQGFTYDAASSSVRQVLGSFGSAALGPALLRGLDFASVMPQRSYGVGCASGQCFSISGLGSEQIHQNPIPDQFGIPEAAAWSADGRVAVLYSRSEQWVRVLHGLPEVDAAPQWNVSSLGGQLSSVAVGADGQRIFMAIAGDRPGVFEITAAGSFVPVLGATNPVGLSFSTNGETLYVLDAGIHGMLEIHVEDGRAQSWPLDAVQDPTAVQPGRNAAGHPVLYVAGRSDRALFVYDATDHRLIEQIALTFAPTQVQPSGAGSYMLTARASQDELLWSFTTGRGVFFVPAAPESEPSETSGLPQRRVRR